MEDPNSGINMTLVGLALKSQKPGQTFSAAATQTLQRHFPAIPNDELLERVSNLRKAKCQITIAKCGSIITMKPATATPSVSLGSGMSSPVKIEAMSPMSSIKTSPAKQNHPYRHLRPPDLDQLEITDSGEGSNPSVICSPRKRPFKFEPTTVTPPQRHKRISSPQTAIKHYTPQRSIKRKAPATITSYITYTGRQKYSPMITREDLWSNNSSPLRTVVSNKTAKLRRERNLARISAFQRPRSPLNFDMGPSSKDQILRAPQIMDVHETHKSTDNQQGCFDKTVRRMAPHDFEGHGSSGYTHSPQRARMKADDSELASISTVNLSDSLECTETHLQPLATEINSLVDDKIPVDHALRTEKFPSRIDLQSYIDLPSRSDTGFLSPLLPSVGSINNIPHVRMNEKKQKRFKVRTRLQPSPQKMFVRDALTQTDEPMLATPRKEYTKSRRAMKTDEDETIRPGHKSDSSLFTNRATPGPTTLNLVVGTGGLVINIECTGDLMIGKQ